jgi:serine/threonine protein kinase
MSSEQETDSEQIKLPPGYELTARLRPGTGSVFCEAVHTPTSRKVAIVRIKLRESESNSGALGALAREAKGLTRIRHERIAQCYDVFEFGGYLWYTREFVEGKYLADLFERGKELNAFFREELYDKKGFLKLDYALLIASHLLHTLCYAHDLGQPHLELNPQAVILVKGPDLKIADFRIDQFKRERDGTDPFVKSANFDPPEYGEKDALPAKIDMFAFGCILYQLLTNQPAFKRGSFSAPADIKGLAPHVPKYLAEVAQKCIELKAADRYATMEELKIALEEAEGLLRVQFRTSLTKAVPISGISSSSAAVRTPTPGQMGEFTPHGSKRPATAGMSPMTPLTSSANAEAARRIQAQDAVDQDTGPSLGKIAAILGIIMVMALGLVALKMLKGGGGSESSGGETPAVIATPAPNRPRRPEPEATPAAPADPVAGHYYGRIIMADGGDARAHFSIERVGIDYEITWIDSHLRTFKPADFDLEPGGAVAFGFASNENNSMEFSGTFANGEMSGTIYERKTSLTGTEDTRYGRFQVKLSVGAGAAPAPAE